LIRKSVPRTAWSGSIESSFVQDPQAGIEEKVSVVWLHEYKMRVSKRFSTWSASIADVIAETQAEGQISKDLPG